MMWKNSNTLLREKVFNTGNRLTFEEVCKICSSPKRFIRYVQENKDLYFTVGEFDKVEPILSYIPREFFQPIYMISKDFLDMVYKYIKEILPLGEGGEVDIYRGVRLDDESDFDWNDIGNCWCYEWDSVFEFLKYFTDETKKPYLLTASTDSDNVDWIASICLNMTHINEKELRLYDVNKIEDPFIESADEYMEKDY